MSVHQHGRRRGISRDIPRTDTALCRSEIRSVSSRNRAAKTPAAFPLRDRRATPRAAPAILAFRPVGDPAVELGEKLAGMKMLARPGDRIGSGHVIVFPVAKLMAPAYRDRMPAGSGTMSTICFAKMSRNATISADSPALTGRKKEGFRGFAPLRFSIMKKEIRLNAFAMNCVAHQSPGLWTHPRDRTRGI